MVSLCYQQNQSSVKFLVSRSDWACPGTLTAYMSDSIKAKKIVTSDHLVTENGSQW